MLTIRKLKIVARPIMAGCIAALAFVRRIPRPGAFHFGLRVINDDYIAPGHGLAPMAKDMEIVTCSKAQWRTRIRSATRATSCPAAQRMSAGRGIMHSEFNLNADQRTHLLQIDGSGPHRRHGVL